LAQPRHESFHVVSSCETPEIESRGTFASVDSAVAAAAKAWSFARVLVVGELETAAEGGGVAWEPHPTKAAAPRRTRQERNRSMANLRGRRCKTGAGPVG
jgi:hypothetical protein